MLNSWCQCECLETSIRAAAFRSLLSLPSNTARWRRAPACRRLPTCSLGPGRAPATAPGCPHPWEHPPPPPALSLRPFPTVRACTDLQEPFVPVGPWRRGAILGDAPATRFGCPAAHGTAQGFVLAAKITLGLEPAAGGEWARPPLLGAGCEAGAGAHSRWTLLAPSGMLRRHGLGFASTAYI